MSKREPRLLIEDILEAADKIKQYTVGFSFNDFIRDSKTIDAVIRNFEIIGEAARRIPEDFKAKHTRIDWLRVIGFRNRVVHDYMGVDHKIVWTIIEKDLDTLVSDLRKILKELK